METIFGLTEEQIRKMCQKDYEKDFAFNSIPIKMNDTFLAPCIRGGEEILKDPEKRKMFHDILRG